MTDRTPALLYGVQSGPIRYARWGSLALGGVSVFVGVWGRLAGANAFPGMAALLLGLAMGLAVLGGGIHAFHNAGLLPSLGPVTAVLVGVGVASVLPVSVIGGSSGLGPREWIGIGLVLGGSGLLAIGIGLLGWYLRRWAV